MNCPKCGQPLAEGVKFCPMCGLDLSTVPAPAHAPAPEPEAKKTFCAGCGARIDAGLKFCPACGTPVPAPATAPAPAGTELTKPKKKTKKKWFIIAGCAVVAIAIAVVLFLVLGGKDGASSPEDLAPTVASICVNRGNYTMQENEEYIDYLCTPALRRAGERLNIDVTFSTSRSEMKDKLLQFVNQSTTREELRKHRNYTITTSVNYSIDISMRIVGGEYGNFTESELNSIQDYAKVTIYFSYEPQYNYDYSGEATAIAEYHFYAIKMDGRWYVLDLVYFR